MDQEALADLVGRVLAQRTAGQAVVFGRSLKKASASQALAELLDCLPAPLSAPDAGLKALSEIARSHAEAILNAVLHRDLAYDLETMDSLAAETLAAELIRLLPASSRFWTNGDLGLRRNNGSWNPLSRATFDTGIIGIANSVGLVVWFLDED